MSNICGFKPSGRCGLADGSSTLLAEFSAEIERTLAETAGGLIGRVGSKTCYFSCARQPLLRRLCIGFEMRSNRFSPSDVGSALITEGTPLGKLQTAPWAKGHAGQPEFH
jgi:hypothetical protein